MQRKGSKDFRPAPTILSEIGPGFDGAPSRLVPIVLWFLLLAWVVRVTVFVRRRPGAEFADVDVVAGIQIFIVIIILVAVLFSARALPIWFRTAGTSVRMIFVYYVLSALSALWSPMPEYSLYRASEFIISFSGALVALSYARNFLKAERTVLIVSTIVIISSMYVKNIPIGGRLILESWHTNSYSASAAILFCYCFGEYFGGDRNRRSALKWFGFLALGALVVGTSAGSNVGAAVGFLIVALLRRSIALALVGSVVFVILFVIAILFGSIGDFVSSVIMTGLFPGKTAGQIYSVGGRLGMWENLFKLVVNSPIIGHGFAVLSTGRGYVFSSSPHNSLFSVLLGTGSIGMFAVLLYGIRTLREFFQAVIPRRPGSVGSAAAITAGLVNSLAMPLVFDEWEESTLVFICITAFSFLFVYLPYKSTKTVQNKEPLRQRANVET